ncbi:MAG: LON peptidase substrate-binding domain-containing protein [Planctomycetes bacterium]|nr:LON peptidase substrate-binding domain-containing protein [Planctomycetota bacterium]
MDLSFDAAAFSGHVPLFPLPSTVLLPGALLPLHVFEPRYRDMVRHALDGERLIAMALLRPGWEPDYHGAPEIEEHVCVGRILLEQPLEDGRWNVLLVGLRRARVLDEDRSRPFRVARVAVLEDAPPDDDEPTAAALGALLRGVPDDLVRDESRRDLVLHLLRQPAPPGEGVPLGTLVDLAGDLLHLGVQDRQRLLEAEAVDERARRLRALVERRASELEAVRRRPPGGFSRN